MKRLVLALALAVAACAAFAQANLNIDTATGGGGYSSSIRNVPTYTDALVVTANSSATQTIPSGSRFVLFAANCNFYAKRGASASVPAATTTDGSAAELNPAAWNVAGQTQLTVIAPTACVVTVSFYK